MKGSFTRAMRDREGHLKTADGGGLFLGEIGELGRGEQAMLLRALEYLTRFGLAWDDLFEAILKLLALGGLSLQ